MLANTRQTLDQSLDISDSKRAIEVSAPRSGKQSYKCCATLRQPSYAMSPAEVGNGSR